jgi:hypothetical protein
MRDALSLRSSRVPAAQCRQHDIVLLGFLRQNISPQPVRATRYYTSSSQRLFLGLGKQDLQVELASYTLLLAYDPNASFVLLSDGSVIVRVKTTPNDPIFEVEDIGIGIALDDLQHLFEKFYRTRQREACALYGSG